MSARPRLTSIEIGLIVRDYQRHLPEWQIVEGDTLLRVGGCIAQAIWFDRLRTGAYRPTARVHVLAAPDEHGGTVVLPHFLGVKNREVLRHEHQRRLPAVLDALRAEVSPPIEKALDAGAVAEMVAARSSGRPSGAYAAACLFAALGREIDARHWIGEYHAAVKAVGLPEQPIDTYRASFLSQLEAWMETSTSDVELSGVVEREKAKLLANG